MSETPDQTSLRARSIAVRRVKHTIEPEKASRPATFIDVAEASAMGTIAALEAYNTRRR